MKIFYITPRVPFPIDKGDKLRAFYQIKYLSKNHDVFLYALDENSSDYDFNKLPFAQFCKKYVIEKISRMQIIRNLIQGIFRSIPFQTSYYYSSKTRRNIEKEISEFKPDLIYCQLIRCAAFVNEIKDVPKVIDYVDVISKGLERRRKNSNLFWKVFLWFEHDRAVKYEQQVYKDFTKSIIITEEDKSLLPLKENENVAVLPNGIDLDYYHPIQAEKKYDLFFSGNLSYPPNIDAANFLVNTILPILKKKHPHIKILIAGASPTNKLLALQSDNVDVRGWIDDLRDYYKISKIFIAPLRIGTGLQNKLLQAMAMEIPCVVSELASRGISSKGSICVLTANEANEYCDHVSLLLENETKAKELATAGLNFVKQHFGWESIMQNMEEVLRKI